MYHAHCTVILNLSYATPARATRAENLEERFIKKVVKLFIIIRTLVIIYFMPFGKELWKNALSETKTDVLKNCPRLKI